MASHTYLPEIRYFHSLALPLANVCACVCVCVSVYTVILEQFTVLGYIHACIYERELSPAQIQSQADSHACTHEDMVLSLIDLSIYIYIALQL